jgi:ABC-type sugar transport system ATPase subunit
MNEKTVLSLQHIHKSFYGSAALDDINLDFLEGEVHIVCGENGAGKSTLMKILSGIYTRDSGDITLFGEPYIIRQPIEAENKGIITIYQEFNLAPTISVAENIFLHREPGRFFINRRQMCADAQQYLDQIGCKISPRVKLAHLSTANQQMVQIAKALSQNAKILIMDEPCASITEQDTEKLFSLIRELKKKGLTIIYIDHRIENFKKIGDRVTVLRDGKQIGTLNMADAAREEIIHMMVGRELNEVFPKSSAPRDEIQFEVKNYNTSKLSNISFSVRKGEVFGLAGLVGAGRTEIVRAIFGLDPLLPDSETRINGKPIVIKTPQTAIKNGIAFIPEDRKIMGFVPGRTIDFNLVLTCIQKIGKTIFVDSRQEKQMAAKQRDNLQIKSLGVNTHVRELSGGNQQKVVIGKWLMRDNIEVLLMDEPTRGIDVGVKMEIYKLIDRLANDGKAIILITSEMSELIGLCDRIAAVAEGRLTKILERNEFSQETILQYCI